MMPPSEWTPGTRQTVVQSYIKDGLSIEEAKKATLALERRMQRARGPNYYRDMIAEDIGLASAPPSQGGETP